MPKTIALHLTGNPEADELLSGDPLALLLGMLLDQQITMEKAFSGPVVLRERLGRDLDAADIAGMDPEAFAAICARPPAVHRFPGSMAKRIQALCQTLVADYGGDAGALWSGVRDGERLLARLSALPGFGTQKAKIFLALLGKQLGVRPKGWREVSAPYGEAGSHRSIADVTSPGSLAEVRAYKREMKARARASG